MPGRLELPASTLSVLRSNQLSYETLQLSKENKVYCEIERVQPWIPEKYRESLLFEILSLERRCSSHTFRYGYLVTT